MERAAKLIRRNSLSKQVLTDEDYARAIWPAAVGKAVAAHTSRVRLVRNKLLVEVEDSVWQKQLFPLTSQIVARIRQVTNSDLIEDVEFRVAVPRRRPMRAETPESAPADEAETIRDPVLKKVYRLSRKKATA
ncbi:MAG TPA: DUF721 domain-containing protein [Bryobacteraceae bacterium]|jgi:hypothetical protein|nr:DUF721 domain-containing protein [Bryobacteraceae bacterium]